VGITVSVLVLCLAGVTAAIYYIRQRQRRRLNGYNFLVMDDDVTLDADGDHSTATDAMLGVRDGRAALQ